MKVEVVLWVFVQLNVPIVVLPFFITTLEFEVHLSPYESVINIVYNPLQRVTDPVYCWSFDKAGCLNLTTLLESRIKKTSSPAYCCVVLIRVTISWPFEHDWVQEGIEDTRWFFRDNDANF